MNVSTFINGTGIGGESILNTAKRKSEERGGFWSALSAACAEKSSGSEMLYAAHVELTDADIAVLASKYDPSNMTGAEYRQFLQELENMGAVTAADHERMLGYFMVNADSSLSGDLQRKLQTMPAASYADLVSRDLLSGIVDRVETTRNGQSLLEAAADPQGAFWANLQRTIIESAKEKQEQKEEEETIELLTMMLDNMTGRNDPHVSAAVGVKLGYGADQDIIEAGYLPTELHAYLLALGSRTATELVEEPEEDGKVQEVDAASTEKLYANSEKRHDLTEEDLANLAKKYDPNNMSREQYDSFLEDMVKLHVATQDMIERIGYQGQTAADSIASSWYTADTVNAPAFSPSPIASDIQGWIENRMLWKPGITREAAKRAGLSEQYNRMLEEEKTLSRIAEVLADVKRQRYPSIAL